MNEALRKALKQLRLSGLLESLEIRLQEAAGHGLSHAEFLELILQDERGAWRSPTRAPVQGGPVSRAEIAGKL